MQDGPAKGFLLGLGLVVFCLAGPLHAGINWKSVRLAPDGVALSSPGASQHFLVLGVDGGDHESDLTTSPYCQVRSSNPEVVEVDQARGLLIGKSPGIAEIHVSFSEQSGVAQVTVGNRPAEMSVNFSPDVISILTTKGCNGSGCHGSPAGQNGFKLSLFGYDIAADHRMIVEAHNGRRVNLEQPEKSLLLQKPSFAIPHGGGRVLPADSDEYSTILNWLKQGAPLTSAGIRLKKLELYPAEMILIGPGREQKQRLVVIGRLSDGSTRDMTREVRYVSGDESAAKVGQEGIVTAAARGLTTISARAMGQVATSQVGIVSTAAWVRQQVAGNNFIDELVSAKQYRMQVAARPLSSDREFVRRVFLDTIGQLPTPAEVRAFVADPRADKRSRLLTALLERPEYASYWTVRFEDWFRNCQLHMQGRSMGTFKDWIREWVTEDRPYNQVVHELLTSQGDNILNPAVNFWHPATDFMLKKFSVNKITPTVSRLFLGVRMECAECHNHPLENFTQDDFYGLAAFFARLNVKHGYGEYRRTWFLEESGELEHPVTKKPVAPKFLGAATPGLDNAADRREALADWIVRPDNPFFARATVNRIWHEYFGAGIVEPFDDFRSTNMPTNRELLDRLAAYFIENGYRLKPLDRIILNSRTYQLSSRSLEDRGESEQIERLLFARYFPRKLPAEVLLDAVGQVTGVPHSFRNYPKGTLAKDIYVPDTPDYFLVAFGFPRRDILSERSDTPTLGQALHLMNGDSVREKVESEENMLEQLLAEGREDMEIVSEIYERAYARPPREAEKKQLAAYLASEHASGRGRRRGLESVLWAVVNSKEFQLNH